MRELAVDMLSTAMTAIYNPEPQETYEQLLERVLESATGYVWDKLSDPYSLHGVTAVLSYPTYRILREPHGEFVDKQVLDFARKYTESVMTDPTISMSIATRGELISEYHQSIGSVKKYGPENFRVPARIMQKGSFNPHLPALSGNEDMILTLWLFDSSPDIPGYTLVSHQGSRYGFNVSPEGDPYRACHVIINKQRRAILAEQYQAIGLDQLAEQVQSTNKLTVQQLVEMVRATSDYYLPDEVAYWYKEDELFSGMRFEKLESFKAAVKDGRLQVQCTGSDGFMRLSLETAFGVGCANTVGGTVIHSDDEAIRAVEHAQTVFVWEGKLYILDATPPYNLNGEHLPAPAGESGKRMQHIANAPHLQHEHYDGSLTVTHAKVESDISAEQRVNNLLKSFTEELKVGFNVQDEEALYDVLVRLPTYNPMRRAFETILQYVTVPGAELDINTVYEYVSKCRDADLLTRKQLGYEKYSDGFLRTALFVLGRLKHINEGN
jgi:hypothetical protein